MTLPMPLQGAQPTLFDHIGEERLRRLLWTFYARVMGDPLLSPFFAAKLGPFPHGGWPVHIARLEGFWRAVTHGPSAYRGQPAQAHMGLGLAPEHFDRWLTLWQRTLVDTLPSPQAEMLATLAARMRVNLERAALTPATPGAPG